MSYWSLVVASGDAGLASQLLTDHQADPNWPWCEKGGEATWLKFQDNWSEDTDSAGATVLMIAIQNGDLRMVQLLLKHGADVNRIEHVGDNTDTKNTHRDELLKRASCDDVADLPNRFRATPLSVALACDNDDIVKMLRDAGAESHKDNAQKPHNAITWDVAKVRETFQAFRSKPTKSVTGGGRK